MAITHQGLAVPATTMPAVRRIGIGDLFAALRLGWEDFLATPTQLVFLTIIYPIVGFVAARAAWGGQLQPLLWPLASGFALVGPLAALGIYELSRRRERGYVNSWLDAFGVLRSPAMPGIIVMAGMLLGVFVAWLLVARALYHATLGPLGAIGLGDFLHLVWTTPEGRQLLLWGNLAGFGFAALVLATTLVSFPMLLDRQVDPGLAIRTSLRAARLNPLPVACWGLLVALLLALGSLPVFVGLAVVLPVLGHATWHLYRRMVA